MANGNHHLYVRYFCTECGIRVFPADTMEINTIAPEPGRKQEHILLSSFNSRRAQARSETRIAYCWPQEKWVEAQRKTRIDIINDYLKRDGVQFRFGDRVVLGQGKTAKAVGQNIIQRLDERRIGGGIITRSRR